MVNTITKLLVQRPGELLIFLSSFFLRNKKLFSFVGRFNIWTAKRFTIWTARNLCLLALYKMRMHLETCPCKGLCIVLWCEGSHFFWHLTLAMYPKASWCWAPIIWVVVLLGRYQQFSQFWLFSLVSSGKSKHLATPVGAISLCFLISVFLPRAD